MLRRLKSFIESTLQADEIHANDGDDIKLAAAALFVEVMHADHVIEQSERQAIFNALMQIFDLTQEETNELLAMAENRAQDVLSLHEFTSILNKSLQPEDKVILLEHIWKVVFSDQQIDKYEEHLVRRIADLLYISHKDFIRAKHRAAGSA